eukprot:3291596-Ditylum_brightwellii.AAC.1
MSWIKEKALSPQQERIDAMEKGLEKTKPSSERPRKLDIIHAPEDIAKDKDLGEKLAHHALEEGKNSLLQRTIVRQQKQMQKEKVWRQNHLLHPH